jgi:hypothetical protein
MPDMATTLHVTPANPIFLPRFGSRCAGQRMVAGFARFGRAFIDLPRHLRLSSRGMKFS